MKKICITALLMIAFPSALLAAKKAETIKEPIIESRVLTNEESSVIEAWVKRGLKDPDSAKLLMSNIITSLNGESRQLYCGLVKAKNSYGGYSDWVVFQSFITKNSQGKTIAPTSIGQITGAGALGQIGQGSKGVSDDSVLFKVCQNDGYFKEDILYNDLVN
ncbi:hypothetical protein D5F51_03500 [Yersinia hibernica]|uniref:Uncharacterized protein n=1 Tax=Yersinia hibernica TaxID=2339259 RepID=A0ABX5QWP9_9GAMM|nr:hypothetical protein [Yersinia hibernica]QAX77694.1 hypothetical protein D5F51_03500 [Yersinia hibernica]